MLKCDVAQESREPVQRRLLIPRIVNTNIYRCLGFEELLYDFPIFSLVYSVIHIPEFEQVWFPIVYTFSSPWK